MSLDKQADIDAVESNFDLKREFRETELELPRIPPVNPAVLRTKFAGNADSLHCRAFLIKLLKLFRSSQPNFFCIYLFFAI